MKFLFVLAASVLLLPTSIYTLQVKKIDGSTQNLSSFQGRKMLLVNIGSGSDKVSQLTGLKQLQQQFADSLVIIAFPSNSFGKEPKTNSQIKQMCDSVYGISFLVAEKAPIIGSDAQPVFNWLLKKSENGIGSVRLVEDFQKFLIDRDGNLIGVFAGSVGPLDQQLVNAIANN